MKGQEYVLKFQGRGVPKGMQFERLMTVVKQYQVQMFNMIEEQVPKSVYQKREVVRVVLRVVKPKCLKGQLN